MWRHHEAQPPIIALEVLAENMLVAEFRKDALQPIETEVFYARQLLLARCFGFAVLQDRVQVSD